MRIKVFKSPRNDQWYFHFVANNGEVVAQSEGYIAKQSCLKTVDMIANSISGGDYEIDIEESADV